MFKLSLGYAEIAIDTNRNLANEEIDFIIQWLRRLELEHVYEAAQHSYAADGGYCPRCDMNSVYDGCCIECGVSPAAANN